MAPKDPVIVLGTGRSGTSAVAGVLYHLGVYMGRKFIPASAANPLGHFEDIEFRDLNHSLLQKTLSFFTWHTAIKNLIEARQELGVSWGWKDPRNCYILDAYLQEVPNAKVIICQRDPAEVEKSMIRAYGWGKRLAGNIRREREQLIEATTSEIKEENILWLSFPYFLDNPKGLVETLKRFCGIRSESEWEETAIKFVSPIA